MRLMAIHRAAHLVLVIGVVLGAQVSSFAQCDNGWITHPAPSIGFNGVSALAVFDDGTGPAIYVGGSFAQVCGQPIRHLARWNGTTWSSVGGNAQDSVSLMSALDVGNGFALYLVRSSGIWRWDGSQLVALSDPGHYVRTLLAFDDGSGTGRSLYAAGGQHISKWDGATWNSVGRFVGGLHDAVVHDDGSGPALYAAGSFSAVNSSEIRRLARWNGAQWTAVGDRIDGAIDKLLSATFGGNGAPQLYAIGLSAAGGQSVPSRIARWDGSVWHPLPDGHTLNAGLTDLLVWADAQGAGLFVAGAHRDDPKYDHVNRVMKFDGSQWHSTNTDFDGGSSSWIGDMMPFDDGAGHGEMLWVGGGWYLGGSNSPNLDRWDGEDWLPMPGPHQGLNRIGRMKVLDIGDDNGPQLIAGGLFTFGGGQVLKRIARWDGQAWHPFGAGFDRGVTALLTFDDGAGAALYAGGQFTRSGLTPTHGVARWDGTAWQPLSGGLKGPHFIVYDMAAFDDGSGNGPDLYVAGSFSGAGDVIVSNIARWDGSAWHDVGGGLSSTQYLWVHALEVFDDGAGPRLYVAGDFSSAGGNAVSSIAAWDGRTWSDVGGGLGANPTGRFYDLQVHDDGSGAGPALYAAGTFDFVGGVPAHAVARWNGTQWSAVGVLSDYSAPWVRELTVFNDGSGPALFASGIRITQSGIGRWNGTTWAGLTSTTTSVGSGALAGDNETGPEPILYSSSPFTQWRGAQAHGLSITAGPSLSISGSGPRARISILIGSGGAVALQWRRNGVPLVESSHYRGVNTERLEIPTLQSSDDAVYDVVVANDCGTITSSPVLLNHFPCTGDIAPPPFGDNYVDVNDVLLVIARWGTMGAPNPADVNHDLVVNANDLLLVIGNWGACE